MTTQEQRQQWSALAQAATPGEWKPRISELTTDHEVTVYDADYDCTGVVAVCNSGLRYDDNEPNARFIAAARTAVPQLLADVDALTQERDEARRLLKQVEGDYITRGISLKAANRAATELQAERDALAAAWAQVVAISDEMNPKQGGPFGGDTNIAAYNMSRVRDVVREWKEAQNAVFE